MEETLHQRVIGQEEAVVAISRAIRRARVGLKNPNRPIASFIFSGQQRCLCTRRYVRYDIRPAFGLILSLQHGLPCGMDALADSILPSAS